MADRTFEHGGRKLLEPMECLLSFAKAWTIDCRPGLVCTEFAAVLNQAAIRADAVQGEGSADAMELRAAKAALLALDRPGMPWPALGASS